LVILFTSFSGSLVSRIPGVVQKCIYHRHKTKLAVASSDKRKPALGGFAFVQIAFTSWRSVHPYRYTMGCFPWACLTTARDSI
ncbi:hypothetical protein, partial [Escherichia coli]